MRKKKEGLDIPFTDQKNKLERAKKGRHTYQYIFFLVLFECAALPLITLFVLIFKSFFLFFPFIDVVNDVIFHYEMDTQKSCKISCSSVDF